MLPINGPISGSIPPEKLAKMERVFGRVPELSTRQIAKDGFLDGMTFGAISSLHQMSAQKPIDVSRITLVKDHKNKPDKNTPGFWSFVLGGIMMGAGYVVSIKSPSSGEFLIRSGWMMMGKGIVENVEDKFKKTDEQQQPPPHQTPPPPPSDKKPSDKKDWI